MFPERSPTRNYCGAREEGRVLLTNDLDFGMLVFRRALVSEGVVLLRYDTPLQGERLAHFRARWDAIQTCARGHFVVASEGKFRVRPMPKGEIAPEEQL